MLFQKEGGNVSPALEVEVGDAVGLVTLVAKTFQLAEKFLVFLDAAVLQGHSLGHLPAEAGDGILGAAGCELRLVLDQSTNDGLPSCQVSQCREDEQVNSWIAEG